MDYILIFGLLALGIAALIYFDAIEPHIRPSEPSKEESKANTLPSGKKAPINKREAQGIVSSVIIYDGNENELILLQLEEFIPDAYTIYVEKDNDYRKEYPFGAKDKEDFLSIINDLKGPKDEILEIIDGDL